MDENFSMNLLIFRWVHSSQNSANFVYLILIIGSKQLYLNLVIFIEFL